MTTIYDERELQEYNEISRGLSVYGRVEILAMFNNRLLKMQMKEEYLDNPGAQSVLEDLIRFIRPILFEEITRLGEMTTISYSGFCDLWDLMTVEDVERKSKRPKSENSKENQAT